MNDEQKIQALTGQPVTVSLGGKSFQAERATLKHLGAMNRYRYKKEQDGDMGNIDLDVAIFGMYLVLQKAHPEITVELLEDMIPIDGYTQLTEALAAVGFRKPQETIPASQTGA